MSNERKEALTKFWNLIEPMTACMVTTEDGDVLRSRPMAPYVKADEGLIHFITDRKSHKVEELHHDRDIALSFVDSSSMIYVSVSGHAEVSTDQALIERLWDAAAIAWFGDDPKKADVAIITVKPDQAEFWDNDVNIAKAGFEVAKGYFTDEAPDMGENEKLDLNAA
ncbi:pyridoxamine 5'-phosphate oxidase family protein [Ahrensia sp. R2A130]|uniref:pyridoxamine 5'-phosphate oxidase family protein n=1 Tax=Ahrensia sp. R2A130 TaxID=744979 RepID=UPI0001E0F843|nr:pyridoxamine 5'-phosphate oxidase family protein [Ahrensia sp. R2A130]EFL90491.1 general stress protein 26 [Ahrensia sp. R2A130]